ncbi:MAG: hypothetical protein AMXMBFR84_02370 [Candidatus Hydrogenedentota bacterium]
MMIVAIVAVAAALGAVYKFYVLERLTKFASDEKYLTALKTKYENISKTFHGTKPEVVVEAYANKVQPWLAALDARTDYYTLGGIRDIEPIPEGEDARWYYIRKAPDMVRTIQETAYKQNIGVPPDLWFQSPQPPRLQGITVEKQHVERWLQNIQMGSGIVQQLLDAKALRVDAIELWPRREGSLLYIYHVGVKMWMNMEQLATFLNDMLSDRRRCFFVDNIRIRNPYVLYENPPLQIDLVYTMYELKPTADKTKLAAPAAAAPMIASAAPVTPAPAATTPGVTLPGATPPPAAVPGLNPEAAAALQQAASSRDEERTARQSQGSGDFLDWILSFFPF